MHPISWAIASLPGSEYHPYLKGIRQGATREVARRIVYDFVVITLTRVPNVIVIMAAVVLSYLVYRRRPKPPKWGMWPAIFAVLALYGFLAALAPAGWDEPLVLLGVLFAALAGYAWLDPARRASSAGAGQTSGGGGGVG